MYFNNHPSSTAAATAILRNLSTTDDSSTRFNLVHRYSFAAVSCLDTLTDRHDSTPVDARDAAALAFQHLAQEVKNKIVLESTEGLMVGLAEYWLDAAGSSSRDGRGSAGRALRELVTACEENVERLVMLERVLETIVGLATSNGEELNMRRIGLEVMVAMGGTDKGREYWLRERRPANIMEEMVGILRQAPGGKYDFDQLERLSLVLMWGMIMMCKGGEKSGQLLFKAMVREAGAVTVLKELRAKWGVEGICMAEEMAKAITSSEEEAAAAAAAAADAEEGKELELGQAAGSFR